MYPIAQYLYTHVHPRNLFGALGAQDFPTPEVDFPLVV